MQTATLTSKGQITIPSEVRKALNLKSGDRIDFFQDLNGRFVLYPRTASIRDLEGCVPKLDYVPTLEELSDAIGTAVAEEYLKGVARPAVSETGKSKDEAA
jgi:antitoxin PrlF